MFLPFQGMPSSLQSELQVHTRHRDKPNFRVNFLSCLKVDRRNIHTENTLVIVVHEKTNTSTAELISLCELMVRAAFWFRQARICSYSHAQGIRTLRRGASPYLPLPSLLARLDPHYAVPQILGLVLRVLEVRYGSLGAILSENT